MKSYIILYHFYRSALGRTLRMLLLLFLFFLIFSQIAIDQTPKLSMFLISIFIMFEVFYRFHIAKMHPFIPIAINKENPYDSLSRDAASVMITQASVPDVVSELESYKQIQFILEKVGILEKDVPLKQIDKKLLLQNSVDITKKIHGTYVTTMDVFVAYLFLIEQETKLLFTKNLKSEEILQLLFWARQKFADEEFPKKTRIHFEGEGIGEFVISGWTPETKKYTLDWTGKVINEYIAFVDRQKEYEEIVAGLLKKENNNILLVGDPGIGKEALIRELAYRSFIGTIEPGLRYKRLLELMVGQLIAGAANANDFESRLQSIIDEVSHARNIFLYIPEFQDILGSSNFHISLSGALLPYLKAGNLPVIATMTKGNYKAYMEENALHEVFEVVELDEPGSSLSLQMLFQHVTSIEKKYRVKITFKAILKAVSLADRYLQDIVLPGSAIKLLEDSANNVSLKDTKGRQKIVQEEDIIQKIEDKTHIAIGAPRKEEKELLLRLEDKLHERVVDQVEGIHLIAEAIRRIRTGLTSENKPISFLFLGPTGVGKTETAKALAAVYFGGENKLLRFDMSEFADTEGVKKLLGASPGEGDERGELTDKIHDRPYSLILLDEFEKAHPKILDLFLQVFDDGRLTDNKGRTVSFANCVIIATSNAGSEFIRENVLAKIPVDKKFQQQLLEFLQSQHVFTPELLNRFDDIVTFKPLGTAEVIQIIHLLLKEVNKKLTEQDIKTTFDAKIIEKIAKEGFDEQFGARPLRRYIQDTIEDYIAQRKLQDEIKRGSTVAFTLDEQGNMKADIT